MTTKDLIEARVESIGSEVATMAKSDKYAVRSAEAKLIAGIEAGIWGKAGAEKMAAYLLSPAFLRAFYEERIVQLEAALPEPEFDAQGAKSMKRYHMEDRIAAYRTIREATK